MPVEYCVKHPAIRPMLGSFALNYLSPPAIIRFSVLRANVCYGSMLSKKDFVSLSRATLIQERSHTRNIDSRRCSVRFYYIRFGMAPRTFSTASVISGKAHPERLLSAIPPKADFARWPRDVGFVQIGDIPTVTRSTYLRAR